MMNIAGNLNLIFFERAAFSTGSQSHGSVACCTSCASCCRAPSPRGATRIVGLLHGTTKYDTFPPSKLPGILVLNESFFPMPELFPSEASASASTPRLCGEPQSWLGSRALQWSDTALEDWTCHTSSPLLCQSQPNCSGHWRFPISWTQLHWPTRQGGLPLSWHFETFMVLTGFFIRGPSWASCWSWPACSSWPQWLSWPS